MSKCGLVEGRDGFKDSIYKVKIKAKARPLRGQGQGHDFCPRAVREVEDSPGGPHLWWKVI